MTLDNKAAVKKNGLHLNSAGNIIAANRIYHPHSNPHDNVPCISWGNILESIIVNRMLIFNKPFFGAVWYGSGGGTGIAQPILVHVIWKQEERSGGNT